LRTPATGSIRAKGLEPDRGIADAPEVGSPSGAGTRARRRPALLVASVAVALVAGTLAGAAARASEASLDLRLGATDLVHGQPTSATGSLVTAEECLADRAVEIQSQDPASDWTTLVVTATDAGGALIPTDVAPDHTGQVRAHVPASDAGGTICPEATSDPIPVTVAAAVLFDPPVAPVETFKCATLAVRVLPAKPGTTVKVQRWTGSSWVNLGTPVLGTNSTASVKWCFEGWAAIGTRTVRATWTSQDDLNEDGATPETSLEVTKAQWMKTIDAAAAGHGVSITVREAGRYLFRRADTIRRAPASNEKLLLSMALLEHVSPTGHITTWAKATEDPGDGVVRGNVWILGRGDPAVGTGKMATLARRIAEAGVTKVVGRVMGSTGYFARDWWAPGWRDYFPDDVIALPSALTFEGNWVGTNTVANPELRAARELKRQLKAIGIVVTGKAGMGTPPPTGLHPLGGFWSETFATLLTFMNVDSRNFYAEELNKLLSVKSGTQPGTIAGGAEAIEAFAAARGVTVTAYDGSGLSYSNRATSNGIALLLGMAEAEPWGEVLADSLATPGSGTLEDRLAGVLVKAKTGTLDGVSSLSGYVWLQRLQTWAEFSILGSNISKSTAVAIEDKVVRTLFSYGR
jgi:D-alanyl-D-alanine carboxypeptidase/D-alanyl-D-alanine-endopeptidase (penicillin-binding protein 4)